MTVEEYNKLTVNKVSAHKNTLKDWDNELKLLWIEHHIEDLQEQPIDWRYEG